MTKLLLFFIITPMMLTAQTVIKFHPQDLYLNQANFEIERFEGRSSLIVDVGIPINRSIIGRAGVHADDYSFTKFGIESVRVAYRHYKDEHWYYEPYIKEQTLRGKAIMPIPSRGTLNGYLYTTNVGFQLGYVVKLFKNVQLDVYFFGLELGRANGIVTTTSKTPEDAAYMQEYILDTSRRYLPGYVQKKLSVDRDRLSVTATLDSFIYPYIRSGFNIGFKF